MITLQISQFFICAYLSLEPWSTSYRVRKSLEEENLMMNQ
jgi:hypothetical protein